MNDSDFVNQQLLENLRALAADARGHAPQHVEERVVAAFRTRRRRRNLLTWMPLGGAAVAAIAVGLWFNHTPKGSTIPIEDEDASFYPLAEAEALPVLENAMVVRVQLPVSSLRMMGVPVSEEDSDRSVQAELLLGQDGLARGVRLAQ